MGRNKITRERQRDQKKEDTNMDKKTESTEVTEIKESKIKKAGKATAGFVKKHWKKAALVAAGIALGGGGVLITQKIKGGSDSDIDDLDFEYLEDSESVEYDSSEE